MMTELSRIWSLARPTPAQVRLVACFILFDLLFIASHIVLHLARDAGHPVGAVALNFFSITRDDSPAEIADSVKLTLVVAILIGSYLRSRAPVYLAAAGAFGYAMLDNLLMIHEQFAELATGISHADVLFGGMRRQDVAELAALGLPGMAALIAIWACGRNRSDSERMHALMFGGAFAALGAFAAVLDCMHQIVEGYSVWAGKALSVAEDGGEMIVISLTVGLALGAYGHVRGRHGPVGVGRSRSRIAFRPHAPT